MELERCRTEELRSVGFMWLALRKNTAASWQDVTVERPVIVCAGVILEDREK